MAKPTVIITKTKIYLTIYNVLQAIGWSILLIYTLAELLQNAKFSVIYKNTIGLLAALQTISSLEIVHSALGIVKSQVSSNIIQIFSRLFVIWIACIYANQTGNVAYVVMLLSWCVADITRYVYYVFNVFFERVPKWLEWGRYSFFLVLYPLGTLGEMILINLARRSPLLKTFNIFILGYLVIYPFGLLMMYSHMLHQRRKLFLSSRSSATIIKKNR